MVTFNVGEKKLLRVLRKAHTEILNIFDQQLQGDLGSKS